ncbi:MAG: Mg2 and Co2 transporter CorB family protein [uncultured Rubrobacteraceae bacterium]|uniref:Mg2 and Co2 transporter CorB family protein n=1 Tax=uncultured Rubrobacteraceae bacterium TaxID=349277 RepID=A0A6J4RPY4_9ACTN|nr:MAG: Mg2 and Co2 transporter CorB family protein [uncultured Rubrobacteraceae bacterium]
MGEPLLTWLNLLAALVLVGLNAFFVAAEFALVRVRESRIVQLEQEGSARAGVVRETLRDLDSNLSVCQVGITVASLALGWVGEPAVSHLIEPVLANLNVASDRVVTVVSVAVGFGVITYAHLVFGEQAPKYFSIQKAERVSLSISRPLNLFRLVLRPVVWVVNASTNFILRPWGIRLGEEMEAHSEEELRIMITSSTASGVLEPEEREYLNNVFDFGDRVAREVMVPRPDIEALPADAPLPDLAERAAFGRYTRYPVYEGDLDHVLGAVHIKDLFRAAAEGPGGFDLQGLIRECLVVPENKPIEQILREFQKRKLQMAIVIDEWGSVEGLITIEDILEEIVGEIQDEFDEGEAAIERIGDDLYAVDGRIPIIEVNEHFGLDLPHEDFDTIGGFILGSLGRPPEVGDTVEADGATLNVKSVDGPRVSVLTLRRDDGANP